MKMENEVRMIDANALIEDITAAEENAGMGAVVAGPLRRYVNRRPTIDPESLRPKGRWIDTGESYEDEHCRYNYWACSVCENRIAGRYGLHNYCPNCGAKMEG